MLVKRMPVVWPATITANIGTFNTVVPCASVRSATIDSCSSEVLHSQQCESWLTTANFADSWAKTGRTPCHDAIQHLMGFGQEQVVSDLRDFTVGSSRECELLQLCLLFCGVCSH